MESQTFKIITLGSFGVGKSCLLLKASQDIEKFPNGYQCTVGVDFKTKIFDYKGISYKLVLWDTAGQERFYHINRLYYKDCNAVMLVYDVTNRESFEKVTMFYNDFKINNEDPCVFLLLGNKVDCIDRVVLAQEGKQLATKLGISFMECSAYTGENLNEIFENIIENISQLGLIPKKDRKSIFVNDAKLKKPISKCC